MTSLEDAKLDDIHDELFRRFGFVVVALQGSPTEIPTFAIRGDVIRCLGLCEAAKVFILDADQDENVAIDDAPTT